MASLCPAKKEPLEHTGYEEWNRDAKDINKKRRRGSSVPARKGTPKGRAPLPEQRQAGLALSTSMQGRWANAPAAAPTSTSGRHFKKETSRFAGESHFQTHVFFLCLPLGEV